VLRILYGYSVYTEHPYVYGEHYNNYTEHFIWIGHVRASSIPIPSRSLAWPRPAYRRLQNSTHSHHAEAVQSRVARLRETRGSRPESRVGSDHATVCHRASTVLPVLSLRIKMFARVTVLLCVSSLLSFTDTATGKLVSVCVSLFRTETVHSNVH